MHTGMLWLDNSQSALEKKIQKALDYYKNKYGRTPTLCLVHPSMMGEDVQIDGLTVRPYRPVLPGHLWIGIEEMQSSEER